jgi:HAE1 family hydrophobic/amphiphilic exporter-1
VATVEKTMGTDTIYKEDLQYAISILGQYRNVGLKAATAGLIMGAKTSLNLPKGYIVAPKGLMIEMMDNIDRLNKGLALALGILFILLLLQTQSIPATLAILMDAPLEMMGALFFLYIRGMNWSPPVLWGIMLATVMVMATGIFLIDKTEQLIKEEKMDRRRAITTAGPIRLRPVLMTTLTTAAAFIPPMFAPPTGMDRFRPIATAIIGALVSSTLLSLVAVPVFYSIFDDIGEFLRRLFAGEAEAEAREVPRLQEAPTPALVGGDGSAGSGGA